MTKNRPAKEHTMNFEELTELETPLELEEAEDSGEPYDSPPVAADEMDEEETGDIEIKHDDEIIKYYLRQVQKTRLLSAERERDLAVLISQGDKAARHEMIVSNLRLVVKIAKRYMFRGLPFIDLIEEGNVGLIKAVDRFKLSKECRFSTYATWWIRQSVERALINQSRIVRIPVHVSDDIHRMLKVSNRLSKVMNREPTIREIAAEMEFTPAQVRRLMILLKKTCSFEQPINENAEFLLSDTIEDPSAVSPVELFENLNTFEMVNRFMDALNDNEKRILQLRFGLGDGEPQTLDTIGRGFGVTRERIRQLEARALQKLRVSIEAARENIQVVESSDSPSPSGLIVGEGWLAAN
jgi:RNA polymerase primary sigma factor